MAMALKLRRCGLSLVAWTSGIVLGLGTWRSKLEMSKETRCFSNEPLGPFGKSLHAMLMFSSEDFVVKKKEEEEGEEEEEEEEERRRKKKEKDMSFFSSADPC